MKRSILAVVILAVSFAGLSQHVVSWKKYGIQFETPEELEHYKTESRKVLGHDNENMAVDVQVVPLKRESLKFRSDLSYGAREMARDMGLKNIKDGGKIPLIESAYYVTATDFDYDGSVYPMIALVIINEERQLAFEVTIDCYNKNREMTVQIAESFRFTE